MGEMLNITFPHVFGTVNMEYDCGSSYNSLCIVFNDDFEEENKVWQFSYRKFQQFIVPVFYNLYICIYICAQGLYLTYIR
jgi:hypothetical protein